ncbi:MAG TPA: glycosyltransferase family 2 protein [Myxococcota bacterium]|nr:glycosyltransferase family 2 protein [Myxococcota bacterium]HOH76526.1 glycosyltransferase family 2 protein [Myxococcota bacterium]HPV04794.1 glycosyltransferase family 2 protein [Myxococcota bacterium]
MDRPYVSIVLPVFNEVESLDPLFDEIEQVMTGLGRTFEVICCDDGSTDGSKEKLLARASSDDRYRLIFLVRNYGQTAALDAGFRVAEGEVIIPMDADLQNDPADIPKLLARLEQGADLVSGWRASRKDAFLTKTLPSMIANRLVVSRVTGVNLHDYGCTLKAYRASFLKQFHLYGEMHRLIPAYVKWAGGVVVEEKVNHRARTFGKSKYGLSKTFRLILDLLTVRFLLGYSTKPLYFIGRYGLAAIGLGCLALTWTIVKKILWHYPLYTDPFFLVSIVLFLGGFQILFSGLLAELSMRTYFESRDRAPYMVARTVNIETDRFRMV